MSKPALRLLENPFNHDGEFDVEIYLSDKKFYRLNLPELRHLKVDCGEVARNAAINFLAEFIKNHPGLEKITLSNLRLPDAAEAPLCADALQNLAKAIVTVGVINNQCEYPELQIDGINNLPALTSGEIARAKQEGYKGYKLMKKWQEKAQEAQTKLPSLALQNPKAAATDKKEQVKLDLTFKIKHNRYCDNSTNFAEICPSEKGKDYAPEIPQKVTNLTIDCKGYDHLRVLDFLCEFVKK